MSVTRHLTSRAPPITCSMVTFPTSTLPNSLTSRVVRGRCSSIFLSRTSFNFIATLLPFWRDDRHQGSGAPRRTLILEDLQQPIRTLKSIGLVKTSDKQFPTRHPANVPAAPLPL